MNNSLIIGLEDEKNVVELSSFGLEHIAVSILTEIVEALRYKLITFGIPIDGLPRFFCGN